MASVEINKPGHKLRLLLLEENGDGQDPTVWEMDYDGKDLPGDPRRTPAKLHDWLSARRIHPCEPRHLAETELTNKVEELTRSNRELEQFASVASHALREPLRMVATYTQLLAERYRDQLDRAADQYIQYATDGALRMQTLIEDLLTLSCVGKNIAGQREVDCEQVLEEVLRDLNILLKETGGVIHHKSLPSVCVDRPLLAQVFRNLISNALKFRSKQAPVVEIAAEPVGQEWMFQVSDNGIGIAPEHHESIFAVFQRLNTRIEYGGNGIGLALCKKIVEQYGGRIWVESKLGAGATFRFTLPAREHRQKGQAST
jgi:two-component system, chemotaxis family, sensor kinase Cph1